MAGRGRGKPAAAEGGRWCRCGGGACGPCEGLPGVLLLLLLGRERERERER